jgi:large-conductance mechanosensitive channel
LRKYSNIYWHRQRGEALFLLVSFVFFFSCVTGQNRQHEKERKKEATDDRENERERKRDMRKNLRERESPSTKNT